ncbi:hypothetical protein HAX54_025126 [Datura stramonium]|uniref:HVA22-like protein n=1 Tax=Datura stramonium TaxID=4076 RepID=A0ABS8S7H7_DATST|nr:hypothetical protein [Datura stramonium]
MSKFWALLTHLHALAGPVVMLLYPLYASVVAIESTSKLDDEQWLAYWILYSFLTLMEMLQPIPTVSESRMANPKTSLVDFITLKKESINGDSKSLRTQHQMNADKNVMY